MEKRKNMWLMMAVVLISVISFQYIGCGAKEKEESKAAKRVASSDSVSVLTVKVESKKLTLTKTYTGTIEGEQQANIVSQLAERIVEIPVKVGSNVSAGQVLIRLDKSGATSQYYQAQSNMKNFERNLARMKSLYEGGAVSKQNLDDVQTGYDVAKANFDAARSAIEITSPISGVVTEVKLNPGDFAAPGMPIITVAKISMLKMVLSVGEADVPYVSLGQSIKIYSEINPSITATGRISEIAKSADLQTRTFVVKATFPSGKDQWFKPGMFGKAEVILVSSRVSPVIPREAVTYTEQGPKVFIVKDGKAFGKEVKLGIQNETDIEVLEGIGAGDEVVKIGMNNLKDSMLVVRTKEDILSSK
ncbi:MAG: efflux RND transporter periplasmic adaptor subunit [Ignavibacteriales bacterium]|nr:efflux RND transporter periplasmic adaptor subunit [Ignavibacteriales bacterium]